MTRDKATAHIALLTSELCIANKKESKYSPTTPPPLIYDNLELQQYLQQQQLQHDMETHREFILFPTYAKRNPSDNSQWIVKAKGWALSHNSSTAKQKMMMGITKSVAGKSSIDKDSSVMFEERFKYFLATNKRHKEFLIQAIGTVTLEESRLQHQQQQKYFFNMLSTPPPPLSHLTTKSSSTSSSSSSPRSYYCHVGKEQIFKSFQQTTSCFPLTPPPTDGDEDEDDFFAVEEEDYNTILSRPHNPISSVLDKNYFSCYDDNEPIKRRTSSLLSSSYSSSTSTTAEEYYEGGVHLRTKGSGFLSGQFLLTHDNILNWAQDQNQCDARLIELQSICTTNNNFFPPNQNIVNLIEPQGLSVISDIDDTIKDTQIRQGARTVLSKTFFESPQGVVGMADAYMSWYSQGASFHYVSNSPFQLMPMLDKFIKDAQFPPGSMHLRDDGKLISRLVETPGQAKRDAILDTLRDFPQRHFVLVGDSGEIDLEIYTRIALEYPHQILKIYIRDVTTPTISQLKKSTSDTVLKQQKERKAGNSSSISTALFSKRRSHSASDFTTMPPSSLSNSTSTSTSTTPAAVHQEEQDGDKNKKKKFRSPLGMRRAVTTMFAEYAVEPHLTGHCTTVLQVGDNDDTTHTDTTQDDNAGEEGLLDPHHFQHKVSTGEACAQLYHRLEKARTQLDQYNIEIILFQEGDTLRNDVEIRDALWEMLDNHSSLMTEEEKRVLSSSPAHY